MRPRSIIAIVIAALVVLWIGSNLASALYFTERGELDGKIETMENAIGKINARKAEVMRLNRTARDAVDRTLGSRVEVVDHQLRTRLNRLAEEVGVTEINVATQSERALGSPAIRAMSRRGAWKTLRKEVDFVVLPASIAASGTFEQVIELIDRLQSESWPRQIRTVRLDPDSSGDQFRVTIRLATAFFVGRGAAPESFPEYAGDPLAEYANLLASNPFRIPAVAPPAIASSNPPDVTPAPSTGPPPFPWKAWRVTGVAEGPNGEEVWLENRQSKETRVLAAGESLGAAVFVRFENDEAFFRLGDAEFAVAVGRNMDRRRPIGR